MFDNKVVLVTGAGRRIGAVFSRRFHQAGANVTLHYHSSKTQALQLASELNEQRADSAVSIGCKLGDQRSAEMLVQETLNAFGKIDVVVNNASSFYPTPIASINSADVDNLFGSNFSAPLFVCQAAASALHESRGCILNMVDSHIHGTLPEHAVYASAKASLAMLTKVLAKDLAPAIRVNALAPGAILWPEGDAAPSAEKQQEITGNIPLQRAGDPNELANAALFLCGSDATYITGQVLTVDGGRSL